MLRQIKRGRMKLASRGISYDTPEHFKGRKHMGGTFVATGGYRLSALYARNTSLDDDGPVRRGVVYFGAVKPAHLKKDRSIRERKKGKHKNTLHMLDQESAIQQFKTLAKVPYQSVWDQLGSRDKRQRRNAQRAFNRRMGKELSGRADAVRKAWATRRRKYGKSGMPTTRRKK